MTSSRRKGAQAASHDHADHPKTQAVSYEIILADPPLVVPGQR